MNPFFKPAVTLIAVALVAFLGPSEGLAADKSFVPTSGDWSDSGNWSPSGVPGFDDKVTIGSGKTCTVDIPDAEADHLVVIGTLNIAAGSAGEGNNRQLTIDSGNSTSTIDGTMTLLGQYSSFVITGEPATTLSGTGKIVGAHNDAKVDFTGVDLTSQITIEGNMRVIAGGSSNEFENEHVVNANRDGTLLFYNCVLEDPTDGSAVWKTSTPTTVGTPILKLQHAYAHGQGAAFLDGEFQIYDGGLVLESSVVTTGKLKHYDGYLATGSSAVAEFSSDGDTGTTCP
jgi:hypothetical protein